MTSQPVNPERPVRASLFARSKPWLWFAGAVIVSIFVHELGHCTVAWFHGYPAIPTPAKEYILRTLPEAVQNQVALGGILGSVVALLAAGVLMYRYSSASTSAIFAGAMTPPGFYTLRFILAGRGHDATEFQEAQAALGLAYAGHAVDWLFVGFFIAAAVLWFWLRRPHLELRLFGRLVAGVCAGLLVSVLLQIVNNMVFDPIFEPRLEQHAKP